MSVNSKMTAIADAIRAKTGGTGLLTLDDMAQDIAAIDTSENLDEVLDEQDALIADIKSTLAEKGVKPEQIKTATPSLSQQTIVPDSGKTLSGVTVEPITSTLLTSLDSDFKPENIANGVDMFGLIGTLAASAGMQVATGTISATLEFDAENWQFNNSFSVTGLQFKPRHLVVFPECFAEFDFYLYETEFEGWENQVQIYVKSEQPLPFASGRDVFYAYLEVIDGVIDKSSAGIGFNLIQLTDNGFFCNLTEQSVAGDVYFTSYNNLCWLAIG